MSLVFRLYAPLSDSAMLYPVQNIYRVPWAIVGGSIRPHISNDLVFGSMDRQNALEWPRSHDPKSSLIDTLPNTSKRHTRQPSAIPGLFSAMLPPSIPVRWHSGLLKKCSDAISNTEQNFTEKMFSRKNLPTFFENGFSAGSIFGSRT